MQPEQQLAERVAAAMGPLLAACQAWADALSAQLAPLADAVLQGDGARHRPGDPEW